MEGRNFRAIPPQSHLLDGNASKKKSPLRPLPLLLKGFNGCRLMRLMVGIGARYVIVTLLLLKPPTRTPDLAA
jgi:hypothetical protein